MKSKTRNSNNKPVTKASANLRFGYYAKKKAKNRMVAITVKNKPSQPKREGGVLVRYNTLTEPRKPKTMSPAVAANKK